MFIIVFSLGCDRPSGLLFIVPALLLSILTPLFLSCSCFFILFHPCCSNARVFGQTFVHEFPISCSHAELYLLFSLGEIVAEVLPIKI